MTPKEIITAGYEDPRDTTAWMADKKEIADELEQLPPEVKDSDLHIYY